MINVAKYLLRCLFRLLYKVEVSGMEHYQKAGDRVLIVANHTSLLDGLLLYLWLPETPTFAINTNISKDPKFTLFLKFVDLFRMDANNPLSIKSMIKFIQEDNKAVIFPEGRLTTTGRIMKVYEGPGLVADKTNADILPIALDGTQHTPFSYVKDRGHVRFFPKITITVLPPEKISIDPNLSGHDRRKEAANQMQAIMDKVSFNTVNNEITLFQAFINAKKQYGSKRIIFEDITRATITYQQALLKAVVLGNKLEANFNEESSIGVLLPNTIALPVTFLSLHFLGRTPAMLNYTAGLQNIVKALETGQIKTICTAKAFIEKAGLESVIQELEQDYKIIYLEDLRDQITLKDKLNGLLQSLFIIRSYKNKISNLDTNQPAVILFTSGSEGTPKGVVLSHKNILSNTAQIYHNIDFNASDLVFTCLPMFHTFAITAGFLAPVLAGVKTFIYPTPLHYRIIPELFYELGATILFGTNTFYQGYARYAHPYDFNSARYIVAGAEKLREDTSHLYMEKYGKRIYQGYGVTETSPVISVNNPMFNQPGSVGKLVPEMQSQILPVEGIERGGRLCVKGPNVMLGYLLHDKPGVIQFPECSLGAGWYDTGDIAEIKDGYVTILGRAKRFAKIGGEMVSLTLVEEIATQIWPDSALAAVNLADDRKGEKIILVSVNHDVDRKTYQNFVQEHGYGELVIPKNILYAKELPVLGTGKIDYTTLSKLTAAADTAGSNSIN